MPPEAVDFRHRLDPALLPELMDEPCAYESFRDTVRDIAATTRLTGAYTPTLRFVEQALQSSDPPSNSEDVNASARAKQRQTHPVHILDVGSGGGDILRRIALWASKHNRAVTLTGIDLNPHAAQAAEEFSAGKPLFRNIQWLTGDVFTHPATQSPDLVLSSLVTHHMRDDEIVQFLRWMENHARAGWFISDLLRSPRSYRLFGPLARAMRWHPFVLHDGLVSIRRGFREADWQRLLAAAGIPADSVRLHRAALGRLCLTRLR